MLKELCVAASSPGQIFSFLEEIRVLLLLESMGGFPKRREKEAGTARRREQSEPSRDWNGVGR